jgi:adenylate cyclase
MEGFLSAVICPISPQSGLKTASTFIAPSSWFPLMPTPPADPNLFASIRAVLEREALSNERKLAYVRCTVLLISLILDMLVFLFPKTLVGQDYVPPSVALISLMANVGAIAILLLLRRPQIHRILPKLQVSIPFFDGLLLFIFITNISRVFGQDHPHVIANVAAFCGLMALSGAMRLSQPASVAATVLAFLNFLYATYLFQIELTIGLFTAFTILGIGLLGMMISNIVRRQVKNETGRVLMERFLPPTIVETAFESPSQIFQQAQVYDVTIVFTDLRGFTQYSETQKPVVVMDFLSRFQGFLSQIVNQHEGCVISFMGDGMLAVFGAPTEIANHAEQALQAALKMLAELPEVCPLAMGIGIHSGSVVAGCLGSGAHIEFSVIGDAVNVASRIETLTKQAGCSILISETTRSYLRSYPLQSLSKMAIRGRVAPLELFTILS